MPKQNFSIPEAAHAELKEFCQKLQKDAQAQAVLLIDINGQFITSYGEVADLDLVSLGALAAGNVAATLALAKLLGEAEFSAMFNEGRAHNLYFTLVAQRFILLVLFDERSNLGLVRLRVKQSNLAALPLPVYPAERTPEFTAELAPALTPGFLADDLQARGLFSQITKDDIDNLFS